MKIFTKRAKFKEFGISLPKNISEKLNKDGIDIDNIDFVRKGFTSNDMILDDDERCSVDYITTKYPDRDNEILLPQGAVLDYYLLSPIVLYGHDYSTDTLPIGKTLWIKSDSKGLIAKTKYASKEANPLAEQIFNLKKEGIITSKSIGFIPLESIEKENFKHIKASDYGLEEDSLKGVDRIYSKWILLEHSDVKIPSNVYSINLAISKGYDEYLDNVCDGIACDLKSQARGFFSEMYDKSDASINSQTKSDDLKLPNSKDEEIEQKDENEIVEKVEVTENYIRIPINDKSKFDQESFRTIDISKNQGIKAVIGRLKGEDNTSVHTYLFDKEKWSMSEAQTWVDEHKKSVVIVEDKITEKKEEKNIKKDFIFSISKKFAPTKKDIEINKNLFKSFNVEEIPSVPSNFNYDIFSKFLEVDVKDINNMPYFIPNMVKGVELSGFDEVCKDYELHSERNFNYNGSEDPISYEKIQLNSKNSRELMVEGTRFYKTESGNCIITYSPGWGGIHVNLFTSREKAYISSDILQKVDEWVEANNFLKGEKMSISGKFLGNYKTTWDDIFVKDKYKKLLKRTVNNNSIDKASRGFLLIGPPGTGKTLTGKAIMNDSEDTFIWASSDDFKSIGAVRGMSLAFDMARKLAPTTIFVEDIDTWLDYYTVDLLKTEMDGLKNNNGVVTILTSNHPQKFPEALIDRPGRFHHVFNFALPDEKARKEMLQRWTKNVDEDKIDEFVTMTKGLSGAHIKELVDYAKILVEDEEIDFDEALVKSLENILEQRQLISDMKNNIEFKSFEENEDFEIIDKSIEEESEIFEIEDEIIEKDLNSKEKSDETFEVDFEDFPSFEEMEEFVKNYKKNKEEVEVDFDVSEFIKETVEENAKIMKARITGELY